jgi:hypothetical protein
MAATLTSINAALEVTWTEKRLAEQLYQLNPILDRIKKLPSTQVGLQAQTAVHTDRNWGYTALPAAGGNLNAAGQQGMAQATWQYTHHHMQVALQGSAIDGSMNDTVSIAQAVDIEVTGALNDLNRQLSRQLAMDGSGQVCGVRTKASNAVIDLELLDGFNALERGWIFGNATQGTFIDVGTAGAPQSLLNGVQVTAVNEAVANPQVTTGTAIATTAGTHFVTIHGSRGTAGTSLEANGLDNLISSSATVGGIAAGGSWASDVDSTSQPLTLALMYGRNRKIRQKTGKNATGIFAGEKQLQNFYQLTQAQVRFSSDTNQAVGAVDSVSFGPIGTVNVAADIKNERMYFLTLEDMFVVSPGDPYWQSKIEGGGGPLRWVQGTDSYGGKLTYRLQIGLRRRNSHDALTGLQ